MIPPRFEGIYPEIDEPKDGGQWDEADATRARSIVCLEAFAAAMGEHFREGMSLVDYGCGSGRFANFMSTRLELFTYRGVEPEGMCEHFGDPWGILSADERVEFGAIDSKTERVAIKTADVALLISVLTHLPCCTFGLVLSRFSPIVERGGLVCFSAFVSKNSYDGPAKMPGYHKLVKVTRDGLDSIARLLGWTIEQVGTWKDEAFKHSIMIARKAAE